jgi:hypothetical protein
MPGLSKRIYKPNICNKELGTWEYAGVLPMNQQKLVRGGSEWCTYLNVEVEWCIYKSKR